MIHMICKKICRGKIGFFCNRSFSSKDHCQSNQSPYTTYITTQRQSTTHHPPHNIEWPFSKHTFISSHRGFLYTSIVLCSLFSSFPIIIKSDYYFLHHHHLIISPHITTQQIAVCSSLGKAFCRTVCFTDCGAFCQGIGPFLSTSRSAFGCFLCPFRFSFFAAVLPVSL